MILWSWPNWSFGLILSILCAIPPASVDAFSPFYSGSIHAGGVFSSHLDSFEVANAGRKFVTSSVGPLPRLQYSARAFRLRAQVSHNPSISMTAPDDVSLQKNVKRTENRSVPEPANSYRYFDFESSAEAAYVSPSVSDGEMFETLKAEARALIDDPFLRVHLDRHVLSHGSLSSCLASILAFKLQNADLKENSLLELFNKILVAHPKLISDMVHDLIWIRKVDPATIGYLQPLLYFKGFHAIQVQRISHVLWATNNLRKKMTALALQSRVAEVFGVDAHPGARISHSVMLDHASGVVIGETASIGHSCYILHGVTLGATGKSSSFDRHPKVRNNVKIGAGAMILGNIALEDGVVVGAGAVVTIPVPKGETIVGVNRILGVGKKLPEQSAVAQQGWDYSL